MIVIKQNDRGSNVSMVQLALNRAGVADLNLDGIFGPQTQKAVAFFQQSNGLTPDGIVGKTTFDALRPFLVGYFVYTVQPEDTPEKIIEQFDVDRQALFTANPLLEPERPIAVQRLNIPFNFPVVPTNIPYNALLNELVCEGLSVRYPQLKLSTIGRSVAGKNICALQIGNGGRGVFFNASHHANEWITTPVLLKFSEQYAKAVADNTAFDNTDILGLFKNITLFAVPMVNPDGVDVVTGAWPENSAALSQAEKLAKNYPNIAFPNGWKANIAGVDLNVNYPAGWNRARKMKFAAGYEKAGPRDYVGSFPLSEPESRAIYLYSRRNNFNLTVSLHTQGQVIFQGFNGFVPNGSNEVAKQMAAASGYTVETAPDFSGYAGYKDWFVQAYERPGFTVECGQGQNPLSLAQFDKIYTDVSKILSVALKNTAGEAL